MEALRIEAEKPQQADEDMIRSRKAAWEARNAAQLAREEAEDG